MFNEGDVVGGWTVLNALGEGTFGRVYRVSRAEQAGAMKVLFDQSAPALDRLRNEAAVLREFDHPGIPSLLDEDLDAQPPFIVMALAAGTSVTEWLNEHNEAGSFPGDIEALTICKRLLSILTYLHRTGAVHRDIKDANVLRTPDSRVSLIDFGFCKPAGTADIRNSDSFFRVGAARFSPPAKLASPGTAVASHDVFAVGVLGYLMLTRRFPWSTPTGDFGDLRELQLSTRPQPIAVLNSTVRPQVSKFLMDLIDIDDRRRPTADAALARAEEVLQDISSQGGVPRLIPAFIHLPHVTRDPLYGDIRLTEYEWSILATPEMQRLRWIRQLGLTNLVFTGAEHSRLSHALGSLHRVEQILRTIEATSGTPVDPEARLTARLFALVHDVTHIPFGHTLEDELGFFVPHDLNEERLRRLVFAASSNLGKALRQETIGLTVMSHLRGDASIHERTSIKELVSGTTGADVLDYIDRDAIYCGLDHRVDSAIFRQFRLHQANGDDPMIVSLLYGKHGVRIDRSFAVEDLLNVRYAMFLKVYTHPRKAAASALLGNALSGALRPARGNPEITERELEDLGDESFLYRLAESRRKGVATLARALRRRQLPAGAYRAALLLSEDPTVTEYENRQTALREAGMFDPDGRAAVERELARHAGIPAWRVAVYCPLKAPGYQKASLRVSSAPGASTTLDQAARPLHLIQQRHLRLWERWVFVLGDAEQTAQVGLAAEHLWGVPNQITIDRRQNRLF